MGVSLMSMFYPGSRSLHNIWMYGGLLLFSAFILYDTQKLIRNAKTKAQWDPVNESYGLYMDAINLFIRFALMFSQNKKK
jgi:FtsH-binding integral membrane protein